MSRTKRVTLAPEVYSQALVLAAKHFKKTGAYIPVSAWIEQRLWAELGECDTPVGNPRHYPRVTLPTRLLDAIESAEKNLDQMLFDAFNT